MKSKNLNYPIFYLTKEDFDNEGNIINSKIPQGIPIIIMFQSSGCHWCVKAKPEYQKLANKYGYYKKDSNYKKLYDKYISNSVNPEAFVTTIQPDRDDGFDINLIKKIDKNFKGFPHFVVISNDNNKYNYEGNRNCEDIKDFIINI